MGVKPLLRMVLCGALFMGAWAGSAVAQEGVESGGTAPAMKWAGKANKAKPLGLEGHVRADGIYDYLSPYFLDRYGTELEYEPSLQTRFRVGARFESEWIGPIQYRLEYEHDLFTGVMLGGNGNEEGLFLPDGGGLEDHDLRKAFARISFINILTIGGGFTTSHWGLGLIANDGNHGWTPGSAQFGFPRGGDRVLRGLVATGPYTDERLLFFGAYDVLQKDDVLLSGDEGFQVVGGMTVGNGDVYQAGAYGVFRHQEATSGDVTDAIVADVYGRFRTEIADGIDLELAAEGAVVFGETELAPSVDFEKHRLFQMAGVVRIKVNGGIWGTVLDILYASGDQNFDDDEVNNFRIDKNFEMGMLLFKHIIAAQSSMTPVHASDPNLLGIPSDDLDRLPTRGSITNTIAIFPRAWVRPFDGFEVYGGPLIAFSEVPYSDAFNSRLAGGESKNALDGDAGQYYGTEFDLGMRLTGLLWGTQLQLGVEGAIFLPGDAFVNADGLDMDLVYGGRAMVNYAF